VKKVRVALLGSGSSSGGKGLEARLIELLKTVVRHDIKINLSKTLVNLIDSMEPNALVKAMVEYFLDGVVGFDDDVVILEVRA